MNVSANFKQKHQKYFIILIPTLNSEEIYVDAGKIFFGEFVRKKICTVTNDDLGFFFLEALLAVPFGFPRPALLLPFSAPTPTDLYRPSFHKSEVGPGGRLLQVILHPRTSSRSDREILKAIPLPFILFITLGIMLGSLAAVLGGTRPGQNFGPINHPGLLP